MDNGERIYQGLIEIKDMQSLEEDSVPSKEEAFVFEGSTCSLPAMVEELLAEDKAPGAGQLT